MRERHHRFVPMAEILIMTLKSLTAGGVLSLGTLLPLAANRFLPIWGCRVPSCVVQSHPFHVVSLPHH
jgi:hypothetical protein